MDNQNLDNFTDLKFTIDYDKALNDLANECCADISMNALVRGWKDYAKNWKVKVRRSKKKGNEYIVYNKDTYRLTHLLENGHLITNKRGGIGWSAPRPHIKPSFDKALKKLDTAINKIKVIG